MQPAIKEAILAMWKKYQDPITLHDIAAEVFTSPFHFSRVFTKATGVTPGRYLTSIRLFEAKLMLLNSSLTVSDIVCSVGYSSVGTFTTRFTQAVGMTPSQYRQPEVEKLLIAVAPEYHHLPAMEDLRDTVTSQGVRAAIAGTVTGTVEVPEELEPADILVGVFDSRIPQRGPVAFTALPRSGSAELVMNNVPSGDWWVIAVAQRAPTELGQPRSYIGTLDQPVTVTDGYISRIDLRMREVEPTDPPIAITLADTASTDSQRVGAPRQRPLRTVA